MNAAELRSLTAQTLGGSPVVFMLDGKPVEYQGFDLVHDRTTDAQGKIVNANPTLTLHLKETHDRHGIR